MILQLPFDTPSKRNSRVTDTRTGRSFPSVRYEKGVACCTIEIERADSGGTR